MARPPPADPHRALLERPVIFRVGAHELRISFIAEGRWSVTVDGGPPSNTFMTQVEAWECGVRMADEKDRSPRP